MSLSVREIKAFLEICSSKNISRAAERIGTSQPALSILVKRLENYFGVRLFIRKKHGVELTKPAITLAANAKKLIQDLDTLGESIRRQESSIEGSYSIGFHPQVGAYSFSKFGEDLLSVHSDLHIKLIQDNSRRIFSQVVDFNIDFGIVVNPQSHPDLIITPLYDDEIHFWTRNKPSKLQEPLTKFEVLICDFNLPQMEKLLRKAQRDKLINAKRILHFSDLDAVRDFVTAGVGIGILPRSVAQKHVKSCLVQLKGLPIFKEKICLIYRHDTQKSKAAKYIKETIVKKLRQFSN